MESDGNLICALHAPLFSNHEEKLHTVMTFVMKSDNTFVCIMQPDSFILDPTTEDLYFPDECYGPVLRACRPVVKYDKRPQPCLHRLVTQDRDQLRQCPVTLFVHRPPPTKIVTARVNRYIVETRNASYHYRCPHETPQVGRLIEGEYIIEVEPRCYFDTTKYEGVHTDLICTLTRLVMCS